MISYEELVSRLRANRLLTDEQLQKVEQQRAADQTAEQLIERLLSAKWLTRWQAREVMNAHGRLWVDSYRILQLIAKGRNSIIFHAQAADESFVALKLWRITKMPSEGQIERWKKEGRILASVSHSSLVSVVETGVDQHALYLAMEAVYGQNLELLLSKLPPGGTVPVDWACHAVRLVAEALASGAEKRLYHGHLSPSKILIESQSPADPPKLKVLGLGFGQRLRRNPVREIITDPNQLPQGWEYFAPELVENPNQPTAASDLFALGGILYRLVTGYLPYEGQNPLQCWQARLQSDPIPADQRRTDLPPRILRILRRLLARQPEERPSDAGELARLLAGPEQTNVSENHAAPAQQSLAAQPSRNVAAPTSTPEAAVPTEVDPEIEQLARQLRKLGLLTASQVDELLRVEMQTTEDLFTQAGERGWISPWQLDQFRAGRTDFYVGKYLLVQQLESEEGIDCFEARHPEYGKVEFKLVDASGVLDEEAIARLEREGRIAASLDSPFVVKMYEQGRSENFYFLALEKVPGRSLAQWHLQNQKLPPEWLCEVLYQTARALEVFAERKLIHRNVTPYTIMVEGDDFKQLPKVKLRGLGLVDSEDPTLKGETVTHSEELLGMADYVAPEQAINPDDVDIRADIYSLGCVMFHMLTGQTPFDGASPQEKIDQRVKTEPPRLRWVGSNYSDDLDHLLMRMLAREPDGRFENPQALAKALESFAMSTSVPTRSKYEAPKPNFANPSEGVDLGTLSDIFEDLKRSKLLDDDKLNLARNATEGLSSPQLYCNRLVDHGLLTRWQAKQLLRGEREFFVGPYKLVSLLSQGPTTETYQAEREVGRPIVLKLLSSRDGVDSEDVVRFLRAGRITEHFKHPHLVPTLESNQYGDRYFQTMPYYAGRSLKETLRKLKRLPVGWACECIRQAAMGLHAAHEQGVIHRDIQPSSLFLAREHSGDPPIVKVLGFGSAASENPEAKGQQVTEQGELIGTAEYVAPEQAEDASIADMRSDLYALAGTLYHLITGKLPFDGPSAMARLTARFQGPPPKIRQVIPDAPAELEQILLKALENSPEKRFQSHVEFAQAISQFCEKLPVNLTDLNEPLKAANQLPNRKPQSVEEFVVWLERSNVMNTEQLHQARLRLKGMQDLKEAASALVKLKLLTTWQAQRLLSGHGELFVSRYKLLQRLSTETTKSISKGSFLANDALGRPVVVKTFPLDDPDYTALISQLERQGQSGEGLDHPNLVTTIDAGHEQDCYFLVYEFISGRSLEAWMREIKKFPIEWACACIYEVLLALDHAFTREISHLALHPSSIMVGKRDLNSAPDIKLLNLGLGNLGQMIASKQDSLSLPPHSVDYLSPEQAEEPDQADTRSDVFSLGCILFHLLTGQPPFGGQTAFERISARMKDTPPPLRKFRPEVPPELETFVAKALSRKPEQRYQTPAEFANDLLRFVPVTGSQHGQVPPSGTSQTKSVKTRTNEQFYTLLELSHLMTRDHILEVKKQGSPEEDARTAGQRFVDQKLLTPWQLTQLLAGSRDFYISKYKLLDSLGQGGGGTVYKAADPQGQIFALKVLAGEQAAGAENLARFLREGRVATAMDHPNIVTVHSASQEQEQHFLVMEYVHGQDLRNWITEVGPLPIQWTCECIRQAALGLDYAHQHGIVHRDIKPGNLLVEAEDLNAYPKTKVLDLGVANSTKRDLKGDTLTKMNQILGTPDFMAPEQAQAPNRVDHRADIYSLGCTLFFCLTAKPPFEGETAVAKLTARFKSDPPMIRTFRGDVPPELESIIIKMMARDANHRYQSGSEVAEALAPFAMENPGASVSTAFQSAQVEQFYANLQRSNLFSTEEMTQIRRLAVLEDDPRVVAKQMVEAGTLSRWQARQLLEGRSDFTLGDYQLLDLAGRGATGNVYKARSPGGHIVALKVLSPELLKKPEAMARFQREMRLVAALDHPNIVTAYDAGQLAEDCHFIAMEFVPGRDLKHWLAQRGPLPIRFACECIRQAAIGLQHAYEKGIVHRDLKPGNLLVIADDVTEMPVVKMLDMGFANAATAELKKDQLTRADQLLGTPDYMAPEQAEDPTAANIRSDIYSLGCTLFRLITGRPPFLGDTPIEKLNARFREPAPSIREFCDEASPDLEAVIAKMLERYPEDRYATPQEVANALFPFSMSIREQQPEPMRLQPVIEKPNEVEEPSSSVPKTSGKLPIAPLAVGILSLLAAAGTFMIDPITSVLVLVIGLAIAGALVLLPGSGTKKKSKKSGFFDFDASVDLLPRIRPDLHSVCGQWKVTEEGVLSPDVPYSRLQLPVAPPSEYTLRVVARRVDGDAAMVIGLLFGGRLCFVTLDGWGGSRSGLGLIEGKAYDSNPSTYQGSVFYEGAWSEIICKVRRTSIEVVADKQTIILWSGTPDQVSLFPGWSMPTDDRLFIGSHATVYAFQEIVYYAPSESFDDEDSPEPSVESSSPAMAH